MGASLFFFLFLFCQDKEVPDMEGSPLHVSPHLQPPQHSLPHLLGAAWGSQCRWEGRGHTAPHSIKYSMNHAPSLPHGHTAQLDVGKASNCPSMGGPRAPISGVLIRNAGSWGSAQTH